jgi:hypothetical protein
MEIDIGTYVKQRLFDDVYRYGIVVAIGDGHMMGWAKVAWSPRKNHPVANSPYMENIKLSLLESAREK